MPQLESTSDGEVAIYCLSEPGSSIVRYVGWALDPERRAVAHYYRRRQAGRFNPEFAVWINRVRKAEVRVLAWVPFAERFSAERDWTRALRGAGHPLFNLYDGMAKPPGYGQRMSLILRSRCMRRSAATRAKISAALTGRTIPEVTRQRMRAAQLARIERERGRVAA